MKNISGLFSAFPIFAKNCEYFEANMSLRGGLFLTLLTAKSRVTEMPKNPRVRTLLGSQDVKGSKTVLKSPWRPFYQIL